MKIRLGLCIGIYLVFAFGHMFSASAAANNQPSPKMEGEIVALLMAKCQALDGSGNPTDKLYQGIR